MAGRKMTPKGQMAFGGGPPITHLPPPMKAMFQPGPPLEFKKKVAKRRNQPYTGVSQYVALFETDAPAYFEALRDVLAIYAIDVVDERLMLDGLRLIFERNAASPRHT